MQYAEQTEKKYSYKPNLGKGEGGVVVCQDKMDTPRTPLGKLNF